MQGKSSIIIDISAIIKVHMYQKYAFLYCTDLFMKVIINTKLLVCHVVSSSHVVLNYQSRGFVNTTYSLDVCSSVCLHINENIKTIIIKRTSNLHNIAMYY